MTDRIYSAVSELEEGVCNVRRWGILLTELGRQKSMIDPNTVWIIGASLLELGATLKGDWEDALEAARGQS